MRKKKISTGKALLIGGAVLGAGYAAYYFLIGRKPGNNQAGIIPPGYTAPGQMGIDPTANLIDTVNQTPVNQAPQLSPIGTPDNKLKYNLSLKKGDRGGEVEKLQKASNIVSGIFGTSKLKVDGIFGNLTHDKIMKQFGRTSITLNDAIRFKNAVEAWKNAGRRGKWQDYLTSVPGSQEFTSLPTGFSFAQP